MPPALTDSPVGWVSGPVGTARAERTGRRSDRTRPDSAPPGSPSRSGALESLLVDLGSQIQRGSSLHPGEAARSPEKALRHCTTGLPALDARLGGGFPLGRLSEICGPPSSGRTALALALVGSTLRRGGLAGWVDLPDAFDPISAAASGIDLEHLLWVRPRSEREALQSCDRLLKTEGFELIVFDCVAMEKIRSGARSGAGAGVESGLLRDVAWLRLSRIVAGRPAALVVLSRATRTERSMTGSCAELVLEMLPLGARFVGPPHLLEALETTAVLRRHRTRPMGDEIALSVSVPVLAEQEPTQEVDTDVDRRR